LNSNGAIPSQEGHMKITGTVVYWNGVIESHADGKDLKEHSVFGVKDESGMFLSNTGTHLPDYKV
jgi:hypothetical protein